MTSPRQVARTCPGRVFITIRGSLKVSGGTKIVRFPRFLWIANLPINTPFLRVSATCRGLVVCPGRDLEKKLKRGVGFARQMIYLGRHKLRARGRQSEIYP